jgi:peptidoglycan/xylan/chitin deacetylase (PgdA/CDA1 family)
VTPRAAALKARARQALAGLYHAWDRRAGRLRGKVAILAYHRVLTQAELRRDFVQPGMYVLRDAFEGQMRFVRDHLQVLDLGRLLQLWGARRLAEDTGYCVVTFDDGWADNYAHAFPVLRRLGVPATVFLPTRFVGTDEWFWPDRLAHLLRRRRESSPEDIEARIERWKAMGPAEIEAGLRELGEAAGSPPAGRAVLTWHEIADMSRHGISFGSHSRTHAILPRLPAEEARVEIEDSWRVLRARAGNPVAAFSYPNGEYTDAIAAQVEAAGYAAAVTTRFGWEGAAPGDLFGLRRIPVHQDVCGTVPLFAFHIAGLNHALSRPRWTIAGAPPAGERARPDGLAPAAAPRS